MDKEGKSRVDAKFDFKPSASAGARSRSAVSERVKKIIAASQTGKLAGRRIHFIGIGGIGMSALARLAQTAGAFVTGSDLKISETCETLRSAGISVQRGHQVRLAAEADTVVFSSAIRTDNPEYEFAHREGLRLIPRFEMLQELMKDYDAIGVSGAHGKTTTTWLAAHLLIEAGHDPTVMVGGIVPQLGANFRPGLGRWFVTEVDESDGRMVSAPVHTALVTNIDRDHLDHYSSLDEILGTFFEWASRAELLIACGDDPGVKQLLKMLEGSAARPEIIRYGFGEHNDVYAARVNLKASGSVFDVEGGCGDFNGLTLAMPGIHNVLNALGALTLARHVGASEDDLRAALAGCRSVKRRFDILGVSNGTRVVDDYGHHPAEVRATLEAARPSTEGRLVVVFQPHRYSRTLLLMDEFSRAFDEADLLLVMDIYGAGEDPISGLGGHTLADAVKARRTGNKKNAGRIPDVVYTPTIQDAVDYLAAGLMPGDTVITMGAGDVWRVGRELVETI